MSRMQPTQTIVRFTYHAPKHGQPELYVEIREAAKRFAELIEASAPASRERDLALDKLDEAVMHANAAIARHG